jgi:hypothetical protein
VESVHGIMTLVSSNRRQLQRCCTLEGVETAREKPAFISTGNPSVYIRDALRSAVAGLGRTPQHIHGIHRSMPKSNAIRKLLLHTRTLAA